MNAAIYCRISTDGQEDNSSLADQEARCRAYCERQGYRVAHVWREQASGDVLARPGLTALREAVAGGDVQVVVVTYLTRLTRNVKHSGFLFTEIGELHSASIEPVEEPALEDTLESELRYTFDTVYAAHERRTIRTRTTNGRRFWAAQGRWVGPHPYGYRREGRREDARVVVDEAQARVVRRVYDLYLDDNLGFAMIAMTLNAEGLRTLKGAPWSGKQVRDILTNETYAGVMTYAGTRYEGRAPVIIPRDRWEDAQSRRRRKGELPAGRTQVSPYLLTGILFCGVCGARMCGDSKPSRKAYGRRRYVYRWYVCSAFKRRWACERNPHRADELDALVVARMNSAVRGIVIQETIAERRRERLSADLAAVERSLRQNEAAARNVLQAVMDGVWRGERAREASETVEAERSGLLTEQARLRAELAEVERQAAEAADRPLQVRRLLDGGAPIPERKAILQRYVRRIVVYPDDPEPRFES